MKGPITLKQAEDNWQTDIGAAFIGERVVYRGKDLFTELNDISWFKHFIFGITNKMFSDNEIKLMEKIWSLTISYPDPRIWNNRVAAITGTSRSTGALATAASTACSEANIYGTNAGYLAMDFIIRAKKAVDNNENLIDFTLEELKRKRSIRGYGRPLVKADERIAPILKEAKKLGLGDGPHLKLAFEIEKILTNSKYRLTLNAAGIDAALMADIGFTRQDHYYATILGFSAGILPCYIDSINQKEGAFFPLSCQRVNYTGKDSRDW